MANKNKKKQEAKKAIAPGAIAMGQKNVENILNAQSLEELVNSSRYIDSVNESYEQGKGYYNPSLRKNLGSLFYGDPTIFSESGEDVVLDHLENYSEKLNKALISKISENLEDLIGKLDSKNLINYLYHVQPSKSASEKYKDIASVHKELIELNAVGKDIDSMRNYLANYYKEDSVLSYWINGSDESTKKIYEKTVQLKQLELNIALTKIIEKDEKQERVLDEDKLRDYVTECIKGADEKIKPYLYKDLAYNALSKSK